MLYTKQPDIQRLSIGDENRRARNNRMGKSSCLKVLVMIINILFMLGGIGLIGAGAYALMAPSYLLSMLGSHLLQTLAILFIVAGSFIIVFAFIGCCGAKTENKCLISLYLLIVFGFFTMLITCLAYLLARENKIKQDGADIIDIILRKKFGFNRTFTELVNRVQLDLRCCALYNGQADYYKSTRWYHSQPHEDRFLLPESCCIRDSTGRFVDKKKCQTLKPKTKENIYYNMDGCVDSLWSLWKNYSGYIVGSSAGVLVILFLLFATTCVFTCQIRHHRHSGGIHV